MRVYVPPSGRTNAVPTQPDSGYKAFRYCTCTGATSKKEPHVTRVCYRTYRPMQLLAERLDNCIHHQDLPTRVLLLYNNYVGAGPFGLYDNGTRARRRALRRHCPSPQKRKILTKQVIAQTQAATYYYHREKDN